MDRLDKDVTRCRAEVEVSVQWNKREAIRKRSSSGVCIWYGLYSVLIWMILGELYYVVILFVIAILD